MCSLDLVSSIHHCAICGIRASAGMGVLEVTKADFKVLANIYQSTWDNCFITCTEIEENVLYQDFGYVRVAPSLK